LKSILLGFVIFFLVLQVAFSQTRGDEEVATNNETLSKTAALGQVTLKRWKDNKTAAFSFTFDDALLSQYEHVFPILTSFGFKGSFYLNTDAVGDPIPDWNLCGNWTQFIEIYNAGHEIGSHTVTHPDLSSLPIGNTTTQHTVTYELYHSKQLIEQKIQASDPGYKCLTLAYPYEGVNKNVATVVKNYYQAARGWGSDWPVDYSLPEIWNQNSDPCWYNYPSQAVVFTNSNNSARSMASDFAKLPLFTNYVQTAINNGLWAVFQTHDVVPFSAVVWTEDQGSWEPTSTEWFTAACQFVYDHNADLWVAPVRDVMKYMKERDSFTYNIVIANSSLIQINVSDPLDNTIFNFPLTVDIVIPTAWDAALITQVGAGTPYTSDAFTSGGNKVVRASIFPSAGTITLIQTNPLPVELTSFAAVVSKMNVILTWKTATEVNNYGFNVERRVDNNNWEEIGFVNGNGNSNSPKDYSFLDKNLIGGSKIQYRLKQIDNDGQFEHSNVVEVNVVPDEYVLYQNYPNPFNPSTTIRYQIPTESKVVIKIYNILGSEVMELLNERKEAGVYEVEFKAENLPSGTYIYRIIADNFVETKKMILLK
jgi:peptidoglycan/xylan/chitin deacetylase (PgdA/CDA1 family)